VKEFCSSRFIIYDGLLKRKKQKQKQNKKNNRSYRKIELPILNRPWMTFVTFNRNLEEVSNQLRIDPTFAQVVHKPK
jgi:hypothetical protein